MIIINKNMSNVLSYKTNSLNISQLYLLSRNLNQKCNLKGNGDENGA